MFEEYGLESKNFILLSGSYFPFVACILTFYVAKCLTNYFCTLCPNFSAVRRIGIHAWEDSYPASIKSGQIKLFIEGYMGTVMCVFLHLYSYSELPKGKGIFESSGDTISTVSTIIFTCLVFAVPAFGLRGILKFQKYLSNKDVKNSYGNFYLDHRYMSLPRSIYTILFLARRFLTAIILIYMRAYPLFQCLLLMEFSFMNLVYSVCVKPQNDKATNREEIINEAIIFVG